MSEGARLTGGIIPLLKPKPLGTQSWYPHVLQLISGHGTSSVANASVGRVSGGLVPPYLLIWFGQIAPPNVGKLPIELPFFVC